MIKINDLFEYPELQLFVIPGFQSELETFLVDDFVITRLPYDLWNLIEKSQFAFDLEGDYTKNKPFFCIFKIPI
jgi:hypothetical protein